MVRGLAATSLAASCLAAEAPTIPDYQIGDPAEADIVTPIPLVVFDAARTESLRKAEAQKVPPIFRFHAEAGREAEAALRAGFADARLRFAGNLERLFGHSLPLLTTELADPQFGGFLESFRNENPQLPLTDPLAELWALGDSGDVALDGLLANLRPFASAYVRDDALPPGERLLGRSHRVYSVNVNTP